MPAGLRPLVAAIPDDIARLETPAGAQQAFVQRAAHPLRSPLAVLHTQVAVAARAADLPAKDDALAALRQTVQQAVRLINQLPTRPSAGAQGGPAVTGGASAAQHGHALSGPAVPAVALDLLVRQVPEDVPTLAQAQAIDLGCEKTGSHPVVHNNPMALREMAHNLVDNALRYAPAGGVVTERGSPPRIWCGQPACKPVARPSGCSCRWRTTGRASPRTGMRQCSSGFSASTTPGRRAAAWACPWWRNFPPAWLPASAWARRWAAVVCW